MKAFKVLFDTLSVFLIALLLCCGVVTTGCGGGSQTADWQLPVEPAEGDLTVKGVAAEDVFITFHPVTKPSGTANPILPRAQTDSEGHFQVTTYTTGDGAPAGKYRLSFSWQGPIGEMSQDEHEELPERLNRKYLKPETSGYEVTITEGPNQLPAIELN